MQPIDVVVLLSAALSVFYLPFLTARLVLWLLFGRRRHAKGASRVDVDLTVASQPRLLSESAISSDAVILLDASSEVPDLNGLFQYLTDERASDAEALLAQILHHGQLASPQR